MGKLLSEDDTLYEDLSDAVASLKKVTDDISKGEGTLGKLVMDDELYQEAKLLLQEIRAAVDDLRETVADHHVHERFLWRILSEGILEEDHGGWSALIADACAWCWSWPAPPRPASGS